jgi:hypothetical protein
MVEKFWYEPYCKPIIQGDATPMINNLRLIDKIRLGGEASDWSAVSIAKRRLSSQVSMASIVPICGRDRLNRYN